MKSPRLLMIAVSFAMPACYATEPAKPTKGVAQLVAPAETPPVVPIRATKIILVGDSTVAVQGGWGSSFCAEHVTSFVACVNLARGGRSTGSYFAEGSWELALAEARAPGFVATWILIQFGHNDQPGKPGRSTDLTTEFPANLRRYVNEARAAGARPVLVTPLTRRIFKDGQLENSLRPWAETAIRVATEMNVPLLDLNARSSAAVQAMGPTAANEMAQTPNETKDRPAIEGMAQPKLLFDYTHLGRHGADYFAAMVVEELALKVPELRPLLIR
jgi:lysophospholipase L1-like esterase